MISANRLLRRKPMAEINVVPYIDVMLVLLVIFMVTAPLLTQGVVVELPKAATEVLPQQEVVPLLITVDREGKLFLNQNTSPDSPQRLLVQVAAALRVQPNRPVIVRGDKWVSYDKVLQAMALLKQAGVAKVGLMTQYEE